MRPNLLLTWALALAVAVVLTPLQAQRPDSLQPDYRIRINGYEFDPLLQMPTLDARMKITASPGDTFYQMIQFRRSPNRQETELLRREHGLKLDQFYPNFTYLERVTQAQLEKIRGLPLYRWHGNYEPAYKVSPTIGQNRFETPERRAETKLVLLVVLHRSVDANFFAQKLRRQGVEVNRVFDHTANQTDSRIRIKVNDRTGIPQLAAFEEVKWIEEEGDITLDNGTVTGLVQSNGIATPIYNQNIRGEGQIVGIIDAILDLNHCFFNDPANATAGPAHRKVVGYRQDNAANLNTGGTVNCNGVNARVYNRLNNGHGTHTAGTVAGFSAGNANNGIAFNARLTYGDLDDLAFAGGTRSFLTYLNEASDDGAFVHSNSWSDKAATVVNTYTTLSQDLDNFTWNNEDQLVIVSSGNNIDITGDLIADIPSPIRPPFSAKNGLSVAASSVANTANVATGALGPTFDNRRKPDVYAPGSTTTSALGGSNCGTQNCGGSSMATPAVAGAAALARQYYTEGWYPSGTRRPDQAFVPTGALLKATLLNSTRDMNGLDAFGAAAPLNGYPTNLEGWGGLVLDDALFFQGDARNLWAWDQRHVNGLMTAESHDYAVNVTDPGQPLKITLVWTEPPADNANFGSPVVNDLDLRVTAPDGVTFFLGNDFTAAGQSRTNGATLDAVNNVEMVLVNNPPTGVWRISVSGTAVNQGPQGYALVATADTEDPPVPTGDQNTLVVRVSMPGTVPSGAPSLTSATNLMTTLNNYIREVSYGQTTLIPEFVETTLASPLGVYSGADDNFLIEMTQDVVSNLVAANPAVFDRGTADPADDIDRIVLLLNDNSFTGDWATTGPWPYAMPGGLTRRLSVSISSVFNDPDRRLAHAMCHQLGMLDLYNHPGVTFAQPHVDNWDMMANQNNCGPMAWSKSKALWLSSSVPGSILWIPRPPAGGPNIDQQIPLNFVTNNSATNVRAIAVGLTPNVANMADEDVFFFIEARSNAAGSVDASLPESGVLLYYVNENIRQGEGPVRIIDQVVSTPSGTPPLDDAALEAVGQAHDLMTAYGLRVTRISPTGSENTRVRLEYDPVEIQHDINIRVGDPHWTSPDIWVDSQIDGFNATPGGPGEDPIAEENNRIYFTIHNPGPGTAFDVTVAVRVSEPYHTIGGDPDFNRFVAHKFYPSVEMGSFNDFVDWTPADLPDDHTCIRVEIQAVVNDVNTFNNIAQENVRVAESRSSSPYEAVTHHFSVTNPYDYHQLFYFRAENVPPGWTAGFTESKKLLAAHERYEGAFTVTPPDDAPLCTDHQIYLTSWMPKGNTLVQYGGGTLQVNLRGLTTLTATTTAVPCQRKKYAASETSSLTRYRYAECVALVTEGCTNPVRANEDVIIRYEDPAGNPVYRVVRTDALGCYSDTYVVAEGGEWKVTATIKGSQCASGSKTTETSVAVPLEPGGPGGGNFGEYLRRVWFSAHAGSTHPLGDLDRSADANICAFGDLSFPIRDRLNLQLLFGISQMTAETSAGIQHPRWWNLSANAQVIFPRSFKMKPYLRAGGGLYRDKNNNNGPGFNIGFGGMSRIDDELIITPGLDFHLVHPGKDNQTTFLTAHIGFIFR